ncbi:MAG TPA: hypothetical protein VGO45_14695 [Bacteroidia bacterium]|nr:hypothetical protein [Bacteroidia bacterium]
MKPNPEIHELIHSLTKSEKRYFNLFAKRHVIGNENKYIQLFNCIEKQEEYREPAIISQLYKDGKPSNFASEKIYLRELILKSLKQFHEKNITESVLYDRLIQIEILYEKGLFRTGYKLILKALAHAKEHEKFLIHAELLIWKINYDLKLNQVFGLTETIHLASSNVSNFVESIQYMQGFFELFLVNARSEIANDRIKIEETIKRFAHLSKKPDPESCIGMYYYYSIESILALLRGNNREMADNFGRCLDLFKNNTFFCEDEPNLYLKAANNYLLALIEADDLDKAVDEINALKIHLNKLNLSEQLQARAFLYISDTHLCILDKQDKVVQAYETSLKIEKQIPAFDRFFEKPRKADLYFSLVRSFFFADDFKSASKYLNKILKLKDEKNIDPGLIALAMFVQLITMIQREDLPLFRNKLTFSRKYIRQHLKSSSFFLMFCDYLALSEKAATAKAEKTQIREVALQLISLSQSDATINRLCGYFNLIAWLRKKHKIS